MNLHDENESTSEYIRDFEHIGEIEVIRVTSRELGPILGIMVDTAYMQSSYSLEIYRLQIFHEHDIKSRNDNRDCILAFLSFYCDR